MFNIIMPIPMPIHSAGGHFTGTTADLIWVIVLTTIGVIQVICWGFLVMDFIGYNILSSKQFLLRMIPLVWVIVFFKVMKDKLIERWDK